MKTIRRFDLKINCTKAQQDKADLVLKTVIEVPEFAVAFQEFSFLIETVRNASAEGLAGVAKHQDGLELIEGLLKFWHWNPQIEYPSSIKDDIDSNYLRQLFYH